LLDITYKALMQKVRMVDEAVACKRIISAEDIIENRLQDRPAKNEAAQSGRQ